MIGGHRYCDGTGGGVTQLSAGQGWMVHTSACGALSSSMPPSSSSTATADSYCSVCSYRL